MSPATEKYLVKDRYWWLRTLFKAAVVLGVAVILLVLLGLAQRVGWLRDPAQVTDPAAVAKDDTIFTCPMHPQIRQPVPGRCPICGMELVLTAAVSEKEDPLAVTFTPVARQLAGIKTAPVKKTTLQRTLKTIGAISFDESRLATLSAYVDGRIERIFADYTGVQVKKGDHLAVLYSPNLYGAQVEYVQSKETLQKMTAATQSFVRETQKQLVDNARRNLVELGLTDQQIKQLEQTKEPQTRLTIYAPIGGTVIEKKTAEGDYVKTGQPLYRIADLSTVWLLLELFPDDAGQVRFGQQVQAEVTSLPGQIFTGRVAFIDPVISPKTRSVSVRVEMPNKSPGAGGPLLRPGDFAQATIQVSIAKTGKVYDADLAGKWISPMHPQIVKDKAGQCPICGMDLVPTSEYGYAKEPVPEPQGLVVPRSAVLFMGKHGVVYVETEPGRFEIRPVVLGPVLKAPRFSDKENAKKLEADQIVILEGLEEGEEVATAGNFLIDSQMQLEGKPSLIDIARVKEVKPGPMDLKFYKTQPVPNATGKLLEELYSAYFSIQQALAGDKKVSDAQAKKLHQRAEKLLASDLADKFKLSLETIIKEAEHLHHVDLKEAREQFKSISTAVLKLAAQARGQEAKETFHHYYCPMVPDKKGDWLQAKEPLANPYFGSKMLRCGDEIHRLPPDGPPTPTKKAAAPKTPPAHVH